MCFAGFLRVQIHSWNNQRFVNLAVHFIIQHKNSLQSSHLYTEFSDKEHQTELNHLKLALQKNRHDKKAIIKTINKHANKITVSDTQSDEKIHSPIYQRNNKSDWQDIKQTQYPNYL